MKTGRLQTHVLGKELLVLDDQLLELLDLVAFETWTVCAPPDEFGADGG